MAKNDQIMSALEQIMNRLSILESATTASSAVVSAVSATPATNGHTTVVTAERPASAAYNGLPLATVQDTPPSTTAKKTARKGKAGRRRTTSALSKEEFAARQAALDAAKADGTATHALQGTLSRIAESCRGARLEGSDRWYNAVNRPTADGKSGQLPVFEGFNVGDAVVLTLNSVERVVSVDYATVPTPTPPPSPTTTTTPATTPKKRGRPSNAAKNAAAKVAEGASAPSAPPSPAPKLAITYGSTTVATVPTAAPAKGKRSDPLKACPLCHGPRHGKESQEKITAVCAERQYVNATGNATPNILDMRSMVAFAEWNAKHLTRVFAHNKAGYINPVASSQEDAAIVAEEAEATAEASKALAKVSTPQKRTTGRKTASTRTVKNAPMVVNEVIEASHPKVESAESGTDTLHWSRSASVSSEHPTPSVRATAGTTKSATPPHVVYADSFGPGTYRGTIMKRSTTDKAVFKFHDDKSQADGWLEIGAEYTNSPMARNLAKVKAGQTIEIDIRAGKTASGVVAPVVVAVRKV